MGWLKCAWRPHCFALSTVHYTVWNAIQAGRTESVLLRIDVASPKAENSYSLRIAAFGGVGGVAG